MEEFKKPRFSFGSWGFLFLEYEGFILKNQIN
jgi:hypothetical protein